MYVCGTEDHLIVQKLVLKHGNVDFWHVTGRLELTHILRYQLMSLKNSAAIKII